MIKLDGIYFSPLGAVEYIKQRYLRREEEKIAESFNKLDGGFVRKVDETSTSSKEITNKDRAG